MLPSPLPVRTSLLIPLAAALGLGLLLPAFVTQASAEGRANRPDVIPVEAIKKGMTGYGLTVFEGTSPERFEVEVIDVLHNFRPRQEMILVKTKHPRLEVAKIVGGMSGSPIYLDGKMAGAYAYGWTFGVEPVAGVTPIRNMLDDLERPLPKVLHGIPISVATERKKVASLGNIFRGPLEEYSPAEHARQIASRLRPPSNDPQLVPVATPVLLGGLTSEATQVARDLLEPLGLTPIQAGGSGSLDRERRSSGFVDGGAIGVDLVSGDVSAMGLGTVTRVEGDKLVAFGHPMMEVGITSLPTSQARVLWFMASQMRSFKMGEGTYPTGALLNDRQASIVVDQTAVAPVVEVSLKVNGEPGAPYDTWNFEVAHDRFLTPSLLGVALGNGLTATAAERRDVTWSMKTVLSFEGFPSIEIEDVGSTPTGTPSASALMQSESLKAVGEVFNNPWDFVRLNKVAVDISLRFEREVSRLRAVQLLTPEVDPGQPARVRVHLEPYDGKPTSQVIQVPIAAKYAGQTLKISIEPGYAVERVRASPENLAELISNLQAGTYRARSLVLSYQSGGGGAAYHGVVAHDLPPGALDRISTGSSSRTPEQFRSMERFVVNTHNYITGTDSFSVKVREHAK